MLRLSVVFLILALVSGFLGFGGIATASMGFAKIAFFIFLVLFVVTMLFRALDGKSIL